MVRLRRPFTRWWLCLVTLSHFIKPVRGTAVVVGVTVNAGWYYARARHFYNHRRDLLADVRRITVSGYSYRFTFVLDLVAHAGVFSYIVWAWGVRNCDLRTFASLGAVQRLWSFVASRGSMRSLWTIVAPWDIYFADARHAGLFVSATVVGFLAAAALVSWNLISSCE